MRAIVLTGLLSVLALAGCEAQTPRPSDGASALTPTPPQPPRPPGDVPVPPVPPAAPSILQPIVRADWRARLEPGGGCNLSRDGQDYVVIVAGDGVAKIGGRIVGLTGVPTDFNAMVAPGRYVAGDVTIALTLAPDLGEGSSEEELFTKPVRVVVTSGGRTERFEAAWTCGA